METAEVWINGILVGKNKNGHIGFEYDISSHLHFNETKNIIAIKVVSSNHTKNYQGAGIYRSVWLRVDEPVYIDSWGTYFKTTSLSEKQAIVENETTIVNKKYKFKS